MVFQPHQAGCLGAQARCHRFRPRWPAHRLVARTGSRPVGSGRQLIEVDILLEHASGDVVGVEVKAAETARGDDFRGLRHLANRLESRFQAGFVLYAGEESLSFGERLKALPIAAL